MTFIDYITESSNMTDVRKTLSSLPVKHRRLVGGYNYVFQGNNTLKNDEKHVGLVDPKSKKITLAAPWSYSREFCLLHEIGHLVWAKYIDEKLAEEWADIVKTTKQKMKDNDEEIFCMAYATHFAADKVAVHCHSQWDAFIRRILRL